MKRWYIIIGIVLIALGIFSLLNQIFPGLKIGRFFLPLFLIGLGALLIIRPRIAGPGVNVHFPIFGDIRKTGNWEVTHQEIWWLVGSSRFDFSTAVFTNHDVLIKVIGFVADIRIILPEDVGLCVETTAFVNEYSGMEGKQERFLSPLVEQTPNYQTADKRVKVQVFAFVSDIKVKPSLM